MDLKYGKHVIRTGVVFFVISGFSLPMAQAVDVHDGSISNSLIINLSKSEADQIRDCLKHNGLFCAKDFANEATRKILGYVINPTSTDFLQILGQSVQYATVCSRFEMDICRIAGSSSGSIGIQYKGVSLKGMRNAWAGIPSTEIGIKVLTALIQATRIY